MSRTPLRRLDPAGGRTNVQKFELQQFSRRLHQAMVNKGLSQSDLARAVWGEHRTSSGYLAAKNRDRISQYLKGNSFPDEKNLKRIADVLGVPVDELAPDITAATVDREDPELAMTVIAGHPDKVHLQVNTLTSLARAAKVIAILSTVEDNGT